MSRPFFDSLDELRCMSKEAAIIGTGPNGYAHLADIPAGAYRIGLNGAVSMPVDLTAWCIFDTGTKEKPYFHHRRDLVCFMGDAVADERATYTFSTFTADGRGRAFPWGTFNGWATVAGCALSVCYWSYIAWGAPTTVYLLGCDFKGDYWNGAPSEQRGLWAQAAKMNLMIADAQHKGMKLYTLSETMLDVPYGFNSSDS
jgi:hypothetical protein